MNIKTREMILSWQPTTKALIRLHDMVHVCNFKQFFIDEKLCLKLLLCMNCTMLQFISFQYALDKLVASGNPKL